MLIIVTDLGFQDNFMSKFRMVNCFLSISCIRHGGSSAKNIYQGVCGGGGGVMYYLHLL